MEQKYSSKDTSIKVINKIYKQCSFPAGCCILDYGGGKYNVNREYMEKEYGAKVMVYDKYNRSMEENHAAIAWAKEVSLDYVVCSNVLNVILEDEVIESILADIASLHAEIVYLAVYEGDKSGTGKETSKGWQRNQNPSSYTRFIEKYFDIITKKGNIFTLKEKFS